MTRRFIIVLITIISVIYFHPYSVFGDDISDCLQNSDSQTCLQNLTQKYSSNISSIKAQIKLIDSQIALTSLKISQTQTSIKTLKSEIAGLTEKIGQLDSTLNQLSAVYIQQVAQNYKLAHRYPYWTILFNSSFNHILEEYKYLASTQQNNQNTLLSMETTRTQADIQKSDKTQKQQELQILQTKMSVQQNDLAKQKSVKNSLLAITQNQLDNAIAQLAQLRNFSKDKGSTCLPSSPGGGEGGWFYSQRDPQWCNQFMGYSKDTIGEVGCYISSISMIWKKYGFDMTPSKYASNPSHFVGATAWGTSPDVPPGYSSRQYSGYNKGVLDGALAVGHPVIAQISMKNIAGMHFVVLKSGSNGSYKMNDPWYGSDLNFTDYYSTSSILSLRLISK